MCLPEGKLFDKTQPVIGPLASTDLVVWVLNQTLRTPICYSMRGDPIPVRKVPKFGPTILAHIASEMFDVYFWMNRELSESGHMN